MFYLNAKKQIVTNKGLINVRICRKTSLKFSWCCSSGQEVKYTQSKIHTVWLKIKWNLNIDRKQRLRENEKKKYIKQIDTKTQKYDIYIFKKTVWNISPRFLGELNKSQEAPALFSLGRGEPTCGESPCPYKFIQNPQRHIIAPPSGQRRNKDEACLEVDYLH